MHGDDQNRNSRVLNSGSRKPLAIALSKPNSKGFETLPDADCLVLIYLAQLSLAGTTHLILWHNSSTLKGELCHWTKPFKSVFHALKPLLAPIQIYKSVADIYSNHFRYVLCPYPNCTSLFLKKCEKWHNSSTSPLLMDVLT